MKTALITGITGQDGSYLSDLLLEKGYRVHGIVRPSNEVNFSHVAHIKEQLLFHPADLCDFSSLVKVLETSEPTEVYNLAALSFVPASWNDPILTGDVTALAVTKLLEAIRRVNPKIKFYQASSSEMYGAVKESPQNEKTPFNPCTPYGIAKLYGHLITLNYRQRYGMFAVSGVLFNHESPRRGLEFVTRKITDGVAQIKAGLKKNISLGNLHAKRDWGYAKDYVEAIWLMLQAKEADDFVIATGVLHSVEDVVRLAFARAGLDYKKYVVADPSLWRPVDVNELCGDFSKARKKLGWSPKTPFKELIHMMTDADLKRYGLA